MKDRNQTFRESTRRYVNKNYKTVMKKHRMMTRGWQSISKRWCDVTGKYSSGEDKYIKKNIKKMSLYKIAIALGRTYYSVKGRWEKIKQ